MRLLSPPLPLPVSTTGTTCCTPFDSLDVVRIIISFVGKNQYRFIAGINQTFKTAYLQVFPENFQTYVRVSSVEVAKFCLEDIGVPSYYRRFITPRYFCHSAAAHGCVPALQYLRSKDCEWNERTCENAARNGHLHVLQWCRDNGCPWNKYTCSAAALNGDFHILKWCRENGCPWDDTTFNSAVYHGDLRVLQWCLENNCPYDAECMCATAAFHGHLHVLQWCREKKLNGANKLVLKQH